MHFFEIVKKKNEKNKSTHTKKKLLIETSQWNVELRQLAINLCVESASVIANQDRKQSKNNINSRYEMRHKRTRSRKTREENYQA